MCEACHYVHCDYCGEFFDREERHVALIDNPYDCLILSAYLWACPSCGKQKQLPSVSDVEYAHRMVGLRNLRGDLYNRIEI